MISEAQEIPLGRRSSVEIHTAQEKNRKELEARVANWGLAYRGGYPKCALSRNGVPEYQTLDEIDAEIIEAAMCRVRARRYRLFRYARLYYIRGKPPMVLCSIFHCTERTLRRLHRQLLRALEIQLSG